MSLPRPVNPDPGPWLPLFREYRVRQFPAEVLIHGSLLPQFGPESPEVTEALREWADAAYVSADGDSVDVVLVLRTAEPERRPWLTHAVLAFLTLITTFSAGAMLQGLDPLRTTFVRWGGVFVPLPTGVDLAAMGQGWLFAVPFLGVLTVHEMGHFLAARHHRIRATLPFFLPFPPYLSVIGTLGAFIRIKSPMVRRSILFDVGAAGPVASFLVSIPLLVWGLALSGPAQGYASPISPFVIRFMGEPIWLGSGVLTHMLALVSHDGVGVTPIVLHPLAFAGWLGLFVTALNLLPIGQLDGGHILYALWQDRQRWAARVFVVALVPIGFLWWGWWAWGVVVLWMHHGRAGHPVVVQPEAPMDRSRVRLGWLLIVVFLLTFVPVPLAL